MGLVGSQVPNRSDSRNMGLMFKGDVASAKQEPIVMYAPGLPAVPELDSASVFTVENDFWGSQVYTPRE